jgi:hypothetical protein
MLLAVITVAHLQASLGILGKHPNLLLWIGLGKHTAAQLAAPAVAAANVFRICDTTVQAKQESVTGQGSLDDCGKFMERAGPAGCACCSSSSVT